MLKVRAFKDAITRKIALMISYDVFIRSQLSMRACMHTYVQVEFRKVSVFLGRAGFR